MFLEKVKMATLSLVVATSFIACEAQKSEVTPPKIESSDANTTITLIELNDLHAHLTPHLEQVKDNDGIKLSMRGGLAKIKTKIDELRADNGIVMNVGDTFHGGAEALFSNGNDIVELVNDLNIDVGVIGNWDYAYGAPATMARFGNVVDQNVKKPNFEYIAANAKYIVPQAMKEQASNDFQLSIGQSVLEKVYKYKTGDNFLNPTKIIEKNNIKIGFIGLTSDIVAHMSPLLLPFVEFTEGEDNYKALLNRYSKELKDKGVNLVVVMSELGIHKDKQLASHLDAGVVDIFFSAHTHEATFDMIELENGVKVVESGDDTYLGEMKVDFTDGNVSSYRWKLHEITKDIKDDEALAKQIELTRAKYLGKGVNVVSSTIMPNTKDADLNFFEKKASEKMFAFDPKDIVLDHSLDEHLATTTLPLERKNVLENGFNKVFSSLLKKVYSKDMSLVAGFRYDSSVIPSKDNYTGSSEYKWQDEANVVLDGNVSVEDVYRFLPSINYVATASVLGKNLKTFLNSELTSVFSDDAFKQGGGWFVGVDGIKLKVDISAEDGAKLISVKKDNKDILDDDTLSVVSSCARPIDITPEVASTTLCGTSLFSGVTQESLTTADFLIESFKSGLLSEISDTNNVEDISQTPLWPQSDFVQPLK